MESIVNNLALYDAMQATNVRLDDVHYGYHLLVTRKLRNLTLNEETSHKYAKISGCEKDGHLVTIMPKQEGWGIIKIDNIMTLSSGLVFCLSFYLFLLLDSARDVARLALTTSVGMVGLGYSSTNEFVSISSINQPTCGKPAVCKYLPV